MADNPVKQLILRGPLMVDIDGQALQADERDFLQHPSVGGIILFERNFQSKSQISDLIAEIKSLRDHPLLVAVDQEGGRVQRFKEGFEALPPLLEIGNLYDQDSEAGLQRAFDLGKRMASELVEVGVDFSFAPVLDRADMKSQIIGDRAFHADPVAICALASRYIDGVHEAGMKATGKHFPGHGGVHGDSHLMQPTDKRSLQTLFQGDMRPYRKLGNKIDAVMTAHIQFSTISKELPTFSWYWLRKILRQELKFKGLIFSDDLIMKGAHSAGSIQQRATLALEAGCDMILVCNDSKAARSVAKHLEKRPPPHQLRLANMVAGS